MEAVIQTLHDQRRDQSASVLQAQSATENVFFYSYIRSMILMVMLYVFTWHIYPVGVSKSLL